jgi:hypothetical protein
MMRNERDFLKSDLWIFTVGVRSQCDKYCFFGQLAYSIHDLNACDRAAIFPGPGRLGASVLLWKKTFRANIMIGIDPQHDKVGK